MGLTTTLGPLVVLSVIAAAAVDPPPVPPVVAANGQPAMARAAPPAATAPTPPTATPVTATPPMRHRRQRRPRRLRSRRRQIPDAAAGERAHGRRDHRAHDQRSSAAPIAPGDATGARGASACDERWFDGDAADHGRGSSAARGLRPRRYSRRRRWSARPATARTVIATVARKTGRGRHTYPGDRVTAARTRAGWRAQKTARGLLCSGTMIAEPGF